MSFIYPAPPTTARRASDFKTDQTSINELFVSNLLRIPEYQRDYTWEKDNLNALLSDVFRIMAFDISPDMPTGKTHMLTTVVLHENIDEKGQMIGDIVDGQQRITSLFIILSVILREIRLLNQSLPERNPDLDRLSLNVENLLYKNMTSVGYEPRLSHVFQSEAKIFEQIVDITKPLSELPKTTTLGKATHIVSAIIRENYGDYFNTRIGAKTPLHYNYLLHIFSVVTNGLEVSVQRTPVGVSAQRLFMDINSKGKILTDFDNVKAIYAAHVPTHTFVDVWTRIQKALKGTDAEKKSEHFLRTWLRAHMIHGMREQTDLHKGFLHLVEMGILKTDENGLRALLEDAQRYGAHCRSQANGRYIDGLAWLNETKKHTQHRSLLLAARDLEDKNPVAFDILCDEVSKTSLVMQILGVRGNTATPLWSKWTQDIRNVTSMSELNDFLDSTLRAEREKVRDTLPGHILNISAKTTWLASGRPSNTLLSTLVAKMAYKIQHLSGNSKCACAFMDTATLEHIVPVRSHDSVQSPMDLATFQAKVAHIGNLTILNGQENSSASNKPVCEKISAYTKSPIEMTRASVCSETGFGRRKVDTLLRRLPKIDATFNLNDVQKRGAQLAEMIAEDLLS